MSRTKGFGPERGLASNFSNRQRRDRDRRRVQQEDETNSAPGRGAMQGALRRYDEVVG